MYLKNILYHTKKWAFEMRVHLLESVLDLPVIFKLHNLQSLDKAFE